MQFYFVAILSAPLINVWVTGMGMIYIIFLVYPFALQCTILLGLVYEEGFLGSRSAPSRSKAWPVLLWLTTFVVWGFFMAMWLCFFTEYRYLFYGIGPNGPNPAPVTVQYGGTVGGIAIVHLVYVLGYFLHAFRNRSRLDC